MEAQPEAATISVRADAAVERLWLDERSWVDIARGWLAGADELYGSLVERVAWRQGRLWRYERWVEEPRLGAWFPVRPTGVTVPDPALVDAHRGVQRRAGVRFDGVALAWYRDGRDGQAFHRDRDLRWLDDTRIAIVTLGATRPWLLRPVASRHDHELTRHDATYDLAPASGDLLVMGGACQVGWEHSVPKVDARRPGRISLQWRWTSKQGRPVEGAGFRAPRHFSR